ALSLSDHVVVLHHGQVQQIDSPTDIYHRPRNRFVADFLGIANFLEGTAAPGGILLPGGQVAPAVTAGASGAVVGVLRPERIRLANGADPGRALAGRISEAVFLGESVRYTIAMDNGQT